MKKNIFLVVLLMLSSSVMASGKQWVHGDISYIRDFGAHAGGVYQISLGLSNMSWQHSGNGPSVCTTSRLLLVVGKNGVTEEIQKRMLSILLSAYMSGKRVGFYVATVAEPECTIEIVQVGGV